MSGGDTLRELQAKVRMHAESVSLRGEGCAAFLFIEGKGKAIEISRHQDQWWLEFWDSQQGDDAGPLKELTLDNEEEVLAAIKTWLA